MNNRGHLPAGQQMQGGADMGGGGGGPPPNPRGRRNHNGHNNYHHYQPVHGYNHHGQPHMNPAAMYAPGQPYMPYGMLNPSYYIPPPQYQNPYNMPPYTTHAPYVRSPPAVQQQFSPMPQSYHRAAQSPIVVSQPFPPPPPAQIAVPPAVAPLTPSSTHSFAAAPPPTSMPPSFHQIQEFIPGQLHLQDQIPVPTPVEQPPVVLESQPPIQPEPPAQLERRPSVTPSDSVTLAGSQAASEVQSIFVQGTSQSARREAFRPPLPWYSDTETPFPRRTPKSKRKRLGVDSKQVSLPEQPSAAAAAAGQDRSETESPSETQPVTEEAKVEQQSSDASQTSAPEVEQAVPPAPRSETPSTHDRSEDTAPTTPSSAQAAQPSITVAASPSKTVKAATRSAVPAVPAVPALPVLPALPKVSPKEAKPAVDSEKPPAAAQSSSGVATSADGSAETPAPEANGANEKPVESTVPAVQPPPAPAKPKAWAALFAKPAASAAAASSSVAVPHIQTDGNAVDASDAASGGAGPFVQTTGNSLAEALQTYRPTAIDKQPFLEPRGLINTGNMCYMNSVLQVLIFCVPFYDFLDQVGKKAAHSFKSETPLIDAMIMFMREFKVIDSATSADLLRRRLKPEELEQYGDSFTPEFVYEAIRKLPRFASMTRGHQQDAQEFLGFLLESLHDECAHVMRALNPSAASTAPNSSLPSPTSSKHGDAQEDADDWLEVGRHRQRPAVTRSSGHSHASPINKIFGGQLRSELRLPGQTSVTLEPYQPLQLDIGAPEVRDIIDALKALTRPEVIQGDFNSRKNVKATKQIFIESVPPVLILHLKRFQFDAEGFGGTVKIWKKVGYPLEFEFPQEVLSRTKRANGVSADGSGAPRYRLTGVVYHHGKNASGGHYTVDVRRQDGKEWIRIDDTIIRRVRSEDVAEAGAEEEAPKPGSAQKDGASSNRFGAINDEDTGDDDGWKQAGKKWSSVVNGANSATNGHKASAAKQHKESMKENKVAYLLFYQRI
ncbi:hypothetical protein QBC35DRAFT_212838 [Podospora australis]|uniref:ubiquitinyl hydrolase 1 n=1 Tax=Podospora australis TaxID=1536484 RepID=A0AAN6WXM3_9PEZI|nr:hypothetical protein QBC35DRAFT_212838 [Podospora australis]